MKQGWNTVKLAEICEFVKTPNLKKNLPYVGLEHIESHTGRFIGSLHSQKVKSTTFHFTKDLLLYGRLRPYLNKVLLPDFEGHCSTEIFPIQVNKSIDRKFLFYWFISDPIVKRINATWTGARMPRANMKAVLNFELDVPPLPDQRRIVTILDEAFAAIAKAKANAEKNLRNAKELFESYLHGVFIDKRWEVKVLGDLCENVDYGSATKSKKQGKLPVLRMGNIQNGRFVWDDLVYSDNLKDNEQYLLRHNDVLFNRTNSPELVGKTAIYKSEMPAIFAGYLIRINRKESLLDADYLNYYLNSRMANDYGKTVMTSSVNQANISGTKLKGYPIPCPPLKEQEIIVKELDSLAKETGKLESVYVRKLAMLDSLRKSILQKAFNGELKTATKELA